MLKKALCTLALATVATTATAADARLQELLNGQPKPVKAMINRIISCEHFAGEEGYDAARRKELAAAQRQLRCATVQADAAAMIKRYDGRPAATASLNGALHFYE
jgi:hypothetical protein